MREGFGELFWPDGTKFIGNWSSNEADTLNGKYVDVEGQLYQEFMPEEIVRPESSEKLCECR